MKRKLFVFAVALAAATAFLLWLRQPWNDDAATSTSWGRDEAPTETEVLDPTPSATPAPVLTSPTPTATAQSGAQSDTESGTPTPTRASEFGVASPPPPPDAFRAVATRLADGDSFEVDWIDPPPVDLGRAEVRLLGLNAPEADACFGPDARVVLQELIGNATILVEIVETEDDGFGRQIANVWVGDVLVNLALVDAGAALALSDGGPYGPLIAQAQRDAKAAGRGLWTACGADADVVILDLRPDAPGRDDFNPNGEWIEIANLGSSPVDLTGWGIRDESTRHRFEFPDGFVLAADDVVRIGSGCEWDDNDDNVDIFWCAWDPVWNNGGDTAFLVDASGRFVDEWGYDG